MLIRKCIQEFRLQAWQLNIYSQSARFFTDCNGSGLLIHMLETLQSALWGEALQLVTDAGTMASSSAAVLDEIKSISDYKCWSFTLVWPCTVSYSIKKKKQFAVFFAGTVQYCHRKVVQKSYCGYTIILLSVFGFSCGETAKCSHLNVTTATLYSKLHIIVRFTGLPDCLLCKRPLKYRM